MRRKNLITLFLILVITGLCLTSLVINDFKAPVIGERDGMSLGLDLKGGTHLVYEADLSKISENQSAEDAIAGAIDKIERRVNAFGVSEPVIQKTGSSRISIQLPGIRNVDEAIGLIGGTAQLEFMEKSFDSEGNPIYTDTGLTGDDFKQAWSGPRSTNAIDAGNLVVFFEFKQDATETFADLTRRLYNTTGEIAIWLDKEEIMSAVVNTPITEGTGYIEGNFTLDEVRMLAIQLNEGALPVPLGHWERETFVAGPAVRDDVDPTLGADSIRKSLLAGGIGLSLVLVFMVLYYRLPGILASGALLIYAILVLAAFKLIPVTLTLAGVAGFILSVGMAVDANVLIFERLKEELRSGRTLGGAIEVGFNRAWSAIRDSNISTLITCFILYWMGSTLGEARVMGFAATLSIGVLLSMLTALVVTRSFLRLFVGTRWAKRHSLFGIRTFGTTIASKEQE
ncbi:protein translocase subunit SecD [Chloroflexota bacterium]